MRVHVDPWCAVAILTTGAALPYQHFRRTDQNLAQFLIADAGSQSSRMSRKAPARCATSAATLAANRVAPTAIIVKDSLLLRDWFESRIPIVKQPVPMPMPAIIPDVIQTLTGTFMISLR